MSQVQSPGSEPLTIQGELTLDERAELEALRQENSALRARTNPRRGVRWRSVIAAVLLVMGCLLAPVSLVAVWAHTRCRTPTGSSRPRRR